MSLGVLVLADRNFGPPAAGLTLPQQIQYSAKVLWADGLLTSPLNAAAPETVFEVLPGESVTSVCERLEGEGIVIDGAMLRDYLIYTGLDVSIQAGRHRMSAAMSMIEVARQMQDATPTDVEFVVLAGWRIEEIAALLPTSGLSITPEEFVRTASAPRAWIQFSFRRLDERGIPVPGFLCAAPNHHRRWLSGYAGPQLLRAPGCGSAGRILRSRSQCV